MNSRIQPRIALLEVQEFKQLISKAKICERDLEKADERREQFKKARTEGSFQHGPGNKSYGGGSQVSKEGSRQSFSRGQKAGNSQGGGFNQSQQQSRSAPGKGPAESQSSGVICYRCNKKGHFARDCVDTVITCYNCRKIGHKRPDCPSLIVEASSVGNTPARGRGAGKNRGRGSGNPSPSNQNRQGRVFTITDQDAQDSQRDVAGTF